MTDLRGISVVEDSTVLDPMLAVMVRLGSFGCEAAKKVKVEVAKWTRELKLVRRERIDQSVSRRYRQRAYIPRDPAAGGATSDGM